MDRTNRLNGNPSKTQLIWFGTRQQQQLIKLDHKLIVSTFPEFIHFYSLIFFINYDKKIELCSCHSRNGVLVIN